MAYTILIDRDDTGATIPEVVRWTGTLDLNRQVGAEDKSLVLGIEAWRGVSEGRKFESGFYCERITRNEFLAAEQVISKLGEFRHDDLLASKLPL